MSFASTFILLYKTIRLDSPTLAANARTSGDISQLPLFLPSLIFLDALHHYVLLLPLLLFVYMGIVRSTRLLSLLFVHFRKTYALPLGHFTLFSYPFLCPLLLSPCSDRKQ